MIKKGSIVGIRKLRRDFWTCAERDLMDLRYIRPAATKKGHPRNYEVEANIPDPETVRQEAIDKLYTKPIQVVVSECHDDIEILLEEMYEWADSMVNANLDMTLKFDEVSDATDALDAAANPMRCASDSYSLGNLPPILVCFSGLLGVERGPSRRERSEEVVMRLQACVSAIEGWVNCDANEGTREERYEKTEEVKDLIKDAISALGDVEFPAAR